MKKIGIAALSALLCAALCSCANTPERKTIYAMDTAVTVTAYGKNAAAGIESAEEEIYRLDKLMSRSNENGDIYPLNESGSGDVSTETAEVIKTALDISRSADGAFDPTVTPLMDAWGFFGQKYRVPSDGEISEALKYVGYENVSLDGTHVTLKNGAKLDLGGIAKGYASEAAADVLRKCGVESALVSFGSTIRAIGKKPDGSGWTIGLADPQNPDEYIAVVTISDECMSTSGSYEQVFEENGRKYHHIIDPLTGCPAESGLTSVSVICSDPTRADALSTALFVMGAEKAEQYRKEHNDFEAIFINTENEISCTDGMDGKIELKNP